jgi:tripartite-type tricarboxylate transporter receptor subunit TctC
VVENRPGAGGQVGTTYFLAQPADGYTLMVSPATPYIVNNILVTGASYTLDDFAFINAQWSDFTFLAVPNDRPWTTAQELVEAIKAEPGRLSAGVTFGSAGHITTVALLEALGLGADSVRLVTFDGGGPLRTALAGGQVDFSIVQAEGSETIVDLIRPLALFTSEPRAGFEAPLVRDALASYGVDIPLLSGSVRTLIAPAAFRDEHPEDYQKLVAAYQETLKNPEYQAWLKDNQMGGDWVGPEATEKVIRENFDILSQYSALLKQ